MSNEDTTNFASNGAIEWFHDVPRLGRSNDAHNLFSYRETEFKDYINGVIILTVFLLILLMIWLAVLVAFRRLGTTHVGFLSGQKMIHTNSEEKSNAILNRFNLVRFTFLLCALNVLIFCGISVTKGSIHFDNTIESLKTSTMGAEGILSDSLEVFDEFIAAGQKANSLRERIDEIAVDFCPNVNRVELFGLDFQVEEISESLGEMATIMTQQESQTRPEILQIHDITLSAVEKLFMASSLKGSIAFIVLPISFLCTLLMSGTLMAFFGYSSTVLEFIQSFFIMPLILIVSVVFWVLASVFGMIAVINADFCLGGDPGSPEETIYNILNIYQIQEKQPDLHDIIRFYMEGCTTRDPFISIGEYVHMIDEAMGMMKQFLTSVDEVGVDVISAKCGHDVTEEVMIVNDLEGVLKTIEIQADRVLQIIECPRIHTLYVEAVHNGTCTNLPWATVWIFTSLFVIGVSGMMMITLRTSWLETTIDIDKSQEAESCTKSSQIPGRIEALCDDSIDSQSSDGLLE